MGCNVSSDVVEVVDIPTSLKQPKVDISNSDGRSLISQSQDSFLSSTESGGSDRLAADRRSTDRGFRILSPHRSQSVDFSRNGSAKKRDDLLPVATATIIRSTPASVQPESAKSTDPPLPHQPVNSARPTATARMSENSIENESREKYLSRRRSSDGDVGNVTSVTCIPHALMRSNPLLNSELQRARPKKSPILGPRNSRLTCTQSQKDFFEMLEEKIAQGKDYYSSEDERSITSNRSYSIHRNGSSESARTVLTLLRKHPR